MSKTMATQSQIRKKRFTFNPKKDVLLINTVIQNETWKTENWDNVAKELKKKSLDVTRITVKERCLHLMHLYKTQNMNAVKRSGTEEEFTERATLLSQLCEFYDAEKVINIHGPEEDEELLDIDVGEVPIDNVPLRLVGDAGPSTPNTTAPGRKEKLLEKKKADKDRDQARDDVLRNALPAPNKSRKMAHYDTVEEKIRFEMEMKKKEFELKELEEQRKYEIKEKEIKLQENAQQQNFELKKKELENEEKRLEISSQSANNNAIMLKLMEEIIKNKQK